MPRKYQHLGRVDKSSNQSNRKLKDQIVNNHALNHFVSVPVTQPVKSNCLSSPRNVKVPWWAVTRSFFCYNFLPLWRMVSRCIVDGKDESPWKQKCTLSLDMFCSAIPSIGLQALSQNFKNMSLSQWMNGLTSYFHSFRRVQKMTPVPSRNLAWRRSTLAQRKVPEWSHSGCISLFGYDGEVDVLDGKGQCAIFPVQNQFLANSWLPLSRSFFVKAPMSCRRISTMWAWGPWQVGLSLGHGALTRVQYLHF